MKIKKNRHTTENKRIVVRRRIKRIVVRRRIKRILVRRRIKRIVVRRRFHSSALFDVDYKIFVVREFELGSSRSCRRRLAVRPKRCGRAAMHSTIFIPYNCALRRRPRVSAVSCVSSGRVFRRYWRADNTRRPTTRTRVGLKIRGPANLAGVQAGFALSPI